MKEDIRLLVGTGKGLMVYRRGPGGWKFDHHEFLGLPVSFAYVDPRSATWWVALPHRHWGQKLHKSVDQGKSWEEVKAPTYPSGTEVKPGIPATLRYIWAFSHGGYDKPNRLYIGTEPGGLFVSADGGEKFDLVQGLWQHPSRVKQWFGGGRDYPGIHSIVLDPRDSNHIYVGISCAGVFETRDGGKQWQPANQGLRADYLPDPYVEVGHDPHLLLTCQHHPDVLWQQNHCGVFRSQNGGAYWEEVSAPGMGIYYGFALAVDHENPDRAWVIPATSDKIRVAVDQALFVCRTEDGGKTWQRLHKGLPQQNVYDIVLRHGLARHNTTMAFGTNAGNLFVSEDDGDSWRSLAGHLPKINIVLFA